MNKIDLVKDTIDSDDIKKLISWLETTKAGRDFQQAALIQFVFSVTGLVL